MRQDIEGMPAFPDRTIVFAGRRGAAAVGTTAGIRTDAPGDGRDQRRGGRSAARVAFANQPEFDARPSAPPRSLLDPTQSDHPSLAYVGTTPALRGRAVRLQFDCSEPRKGKQRAKL
ncbi:hypothetical protein [Paraburkholderia sp. MM6662-R1]|uniref:hypothetical protein n=1 Tax=Paraburkholderia sp. MM6662-R1 TaxID=2991066 RepID=UPI003D23C406